MTEIEAIKRELKEAIARKLKDDGRAPADLFGVASTAVGETLADLIFSAANSKDHATHLLQTVVTMVLVRWETLANNQTATPSHIR